MDISSTKLSLDHIYIIVKKNAPEAEWFKENGFFITDMISRHPESGTRGRLIYFQNFYIELLWIEEANMFTKCILPLYNKDESLLNLTAGLVLYDKKPDGSNLPFKTKNYSMEKMSNGSCLKIAVTESGLAPLYFILSNCIVFNEDKVMNELIKPLTNHKNKIKKLSNVKMFFEGRQLSRAEMCLKQLGIIEYQTGSGNYIELEFDNNKRGKEINLIKELSIIIKY